MKAKNIYLVIAVILILIVELSSCKKDEPQNCACNRITSKSINYNGSTYNGEIYTKNDCSGYLDTIQITGYTQQPQVGDCY